MLCGTPPDEYWSKPTLPLAKMSKQRHAYQSSLRERCKELPKSAVNLLDILLSVEPENRGSATSALQSEYFNTRPYACDPASLPKYPPSKEIDAKLRESHVNKPGGRLRTSLTSRNLRKGRKALLERTEARRSAYFHGPGGLADTSLEISHTSDVSQADTVCTLPVLATTSDGTLGWSTKRQKHVSFVTPTSQDVRSIEPIFEQDTAADQDLSSGHRGDERKRFSGPMVVPRSRCSQIKIFKRCRNLM